MLTIKKGSENYAAQVIRVTNIKKHPNADKLQIVTHNLQNIITEMQTKEGDLMVFFPALSQINAEFIKFINGFRHTEKNADPQAPAGFFSDNCRVKAIKLRDIVSEGYLHPVLDVSGFLGYWDFKEGDTFTTYKDKDFCIKFIAETKGGSGVKFKGKNSKESTMIDGQFKFHIDTPNYRRNIKAIAPNDLISISYKMHGSSVVVGNVLVKDKLSPWKKLLNKLGANTPEQKYNVVYSSRRVIKNDNLEQGFYKEDIWKTAYDRVKDFLPEGMVLYGEIVGYTPTGQAVQSKYDYGCETGESEFYIYRIRQVNGQGDETEFSQKQIKQFCEKAGLKSVPLFYHGYAGKKYPHIPEDENWEENFVAELSKEYNDKDCYMCSNKVPEEGVVIRKENPFTYEVYKLKSPLFLLKESEQQDAEETNLEDNN